MPVTNWNTTVIDGKNFLVIDVAKLRIPLDWDPSSNVFIAVAAPTGGVLNYPALIQGDDGATPDIDSVINFNELAWDDPTSPSASFTEIAPNLYRLNLSLHAGEPGADGDTVLNPADFPGIQPKHVIVLNDAGTAFTTRAPKVGGWYIPAAFNSVPSGQPGYTLCTIGIGPQGFDWRPTVQGQCIVTGTGPNVAVDLVVRLGKSGVATPETAGNIVGKGFGPIGTNDAAISTVLSSGPPPGSPDAYDRVSATDSATIYFRTERRTGTDTYTTSEATTWFRVKADPIP